VISVCAVVFIGLLNCIVEIDCLSSHYSKLFTG
jgi:hypothetical protein